MRQPCCLLEPDACCLPQASKTQLPADQDSGFLWLGPFIKEAPREGGELDERDVGVVPMVSCIGKAVTWRNETVRQEDEDAALPTMVLLPRVQIVPTEELDKATLDAIAEVSQNANGSLRIKMHDKHAALASIGKHLGMFTDIVQMKAVYGVSDKPMSAEEWKKQYVREG